MKKGPLDSTKTDSPYSFFFREGNICVNELQSVPPPCPAVKHPERSEEGEAYSVQFSNYLFPLNDPSLPGANMRTALSIPILSAHSVA